LRGDETVVSWCCGVVKTAATTTTSEVTARIESFLPDALTQGEVLGVRYGQWIALVALVFAGVAIDHVLCTVTRRPLTRLARSRRKGADSGV